MRRVLQSVGRALVSTGALIVLFVAYQLWATGWLQAADQRELKREFRAAVATGVVERPRGEPADVADVAPPPVPRPQLGDAIGILSIPRLGVEQALVEGAGREELNKGPGHYPHSPLPGHEGNVAVAGHRTTYGAPFNRIDELEPGDLIVVQTPEGRFTYTVTEQKIVAPDDVSVIDVTDDSRITLTTCNPKYSARERLIVVGLLDGDPIEAAPTADAPPPPSELPGETARAAPEPAPEPQPTSGGGIHRTTIAWTVALALVSAGWWLLWRRYRNWLLRATGVVPFLAVLFMFFGEVERALPTNY